MSVDREVALKDLREQLEKIKENNRKQIHLVTLMAEDYCEFAEDVAQLIVNHIKQLPSELKLLGMYVMDSIIKFTGDGTDKYRRLFAAELVKLFVDTFEKSPISHRQNLYKLRSTWQPIFLKSTLFHLDTEVQLIDKAWPIFKGAPAQPKPPTEPKPVEAASEPVKKEIKEPIKSSTKSEIKANIVASQSIAEKKNVESKKSPSNDIAGSSKKPTPMETNEAVSKKPELKSILKAPGKSILKASKIESGEPSKDTTSRNLSVNDTKDTKTVASSTKPNRPVKGRKAVDPRHKTVPEKKRRFEEAPPSQPSTSVQPTAILGSHAFLPPPPPVNNTRPPLPVHPMVVPKSEVNGPWEAAPAVPPPRSMMPFQPLPQLINDGPPGVPPSSSASVITNETPKVNGNLNNRIFVDGRAYEVLHVNNEAVIEQNGLPHRIFFCGQPRDILIDGTPYRLGFDDVRMINIDGVMHPVRFGAPSRELYIGDHPFRGAFNGPPMIANINGRRHEFRLCGPPPEVRIDKDPSYELSRYMNEVRTPQTATPKIEDSKLGSEVTALLKTLKQRGILNKIPTTKSEDSKPLIGPQKPSPAPRMDIIGTAREIHASPYLKEFQIGALMIRYKEVVDALHRPRVACSYCGIAFKDTTSDAYRNHIDVHVQELLKTKETGKSRARAWFMTKDQWMKFDELEEVQKDPSQEGQKGVASDDTSHNADATTLIDAIASAFLNKTCPVCHEKFDEYYDNDEEEWRFKDCVVKDDIAVHRYCVEQMVEDRK